MRLFRIPLFLHHASLMFLALHQERMLSWGAGAALSGIMHLTISVTVIMFELTGALTYILPTMVSFLPLLQPFLANGTDCGGCHQSRQ